MVRVERHGARVLLGLFALAAVLDACREAEPPGPPPVARFEGGEITAAELDAWLLERSHEGRRASEGESAEAWVARKAKELFGERALLEVTATAKLEAEPGYAERRESAVRAAQGRDFLERKNERFEVTEMEIRSLFEREIAAYAVPERRSFRNLLVAIDGAGEVRARESAEELRRRIAAGASFEELARRHSASANARVGGLVGAVDRSQLRGEIGDLVFSLRLGELSPVVCNRAGCMLLELSQILPAIEPDLALHRARLAERIAGERRRAWWSALLLEEAARQAAVLPAWIGDVAAPPLTADVEVAKLGGRTYLRRDLESPDSADAVDRLRAVASEHLLSVALLRDAPDEAAAARSRIERSFALDATRWQRIAERAFANSEEPLRAAYESRKESYRSDPQLELAIFTRPLGGGDPLVASTELARFGRELAPAMPATSSSAALAAAGVSVERTPRRSARRLALSRPDLAVALLGDLAEGAVVGPYRFGSKLYLVRFDVVVPERTLSYLEARDRVRSDFLDREGDRLLSEIVDELALERRFSVDLEAARRFGESNLAPLLTPVAAEATGAAR